MVIASGTITFEFSLTGGDINDPDVEGIFIANDLVFQDNPFATGDYLWAAGSFIGWNSISLERDIGGLLSVNQPSMTFIFRPDFIINAPDEVKRIYFPTWQRIPG